MADQIANLVATIRADNKQFLATMTSTKASAMGTGNAMASAMAIGTTAVLAGTAAVAGGVAYSVSKFADFDEAMTKSTSIMEGLSDSLKETMANNARDMARDSVFSAEQIAESYYFLGSAGLDAQQSIASLPAVTAFATAGNFDLALATDLLTDAQIALGMASTDAAMNLENMTRISDALAKSSVLANATIQQFSESLTNDAATAMGSLNIELETGLAVLSAYASKGKKGAEAGNLFGRAIRLLSSSAIKNAEAFKEMGIEVFDSEGNAKNFIDIIGQMEQAMAGMSDEMRKVTLTTLGFEALAQKSITPLLGMTDAMRGYENTLKGAGGTTKQVAEKQMNTLNKQLTLLGSEFGELALLIGGEFAPALTDFVKIAKEGVAFLVDGWANVQRAVSVVTFLFDVMSDLLANIVIGGSNGLTLLTNYFINFGTIAKTIIEGVWNQVTRLWYSIKKFVADPFEFDFSDAFRRQANGVKNTAEELKEILGKNMIQFTGGALDRQVKRLSDIRSAEYARARKSQENAVSAAKKVEESKKEGAKADMLGKGPATGLAGALERGTAQAFSLEQQRAQDSSVSTAKNTGKSVELQKKMLRALENGGGSTVVSLS